MGKSGEGEMPGSANAVHLGRHLAEQTGKEISFSGSETVQGVGETGKSPGDRQLRGSWGDGGRSPAERPEFKVVQAEYDTRIGKTIFKDVGAMWKNTSKSGNDFYTMKIGKLKLLVFPNRKD